ncbi:MAG TPA: chloride channel protein [Hyphomicrobiales bacterium]|nr:chloride channel protein [Hyphomicrobiales bacterium]
MDVEVLRSRSPRSMASVAAVMRALVRGSELWVVVLATAVGVVGGLLVAGMSFLTQFMHAHLFGIDPDERLSAVIHIDSLPAALVPIAGGLIMGLTTYLTRRYRRRTAVDPITANAVHGGRMSMTDSTIVTAQTVISNGFGASVGLEAGYTQIAAAVASLLGRLFRLRRNDMRVLVGCGAAAGIAAAFDAPLTGAFYGFELIIGVYSIGNVAPVMASAIVSTLVVRALGAPNMPIAIAEAVPMLTKQYALFIGMGLVAGALGIVIMRLVTTVETMLRLLPLPDLLRPAVGGAVVGGLALLTPQVLSSGHGALHLDLGQHLPLTGLAVLLMLKILASAVSIGSGFRGGLFFASLFLGSLMGELMAGVGALISPAIAINPTTAAVVGMSALAVAVVGGPLTMTFLALESTNNFIITGIVLAAAVVSSMTVRETFGYSFSTWRLHLRGESIRSAHDVGWMRSLTAGRMMRQDVRTVRDDMALAEFRRQFPIGSTQRVIVIDAADRYAGIIPVPEAFAAENGTASRVSDLVQHRSDMLLPAMNVKEAIAMFDRTESEALAVVDDLQNRHVLGLLSEAHATRRYAEELDKVRRGLSGEV